MGHPHDYVAPSDLRYLCLLGKYWNHRNWAQAHHSPATMGMCEGYAMAMASPQPSLTMGRWCEAYANPQWPSVTQPVARELMVPPRHMLPKSGQGDRKRKTLSPATDTARSRAASPSYFKNRGTHSTTGSFIMGEVTYPLTC